MRRKFGLCMLLAGCILPILAVTLEKKDSEVEAGTTYRAAGKIVTEEVQAHEDDIVAEGDDIVVTLDEVNIRSRLLTLDGKKVNKKDIVSDLVEKEVLYQKAVEEGYQVDEETVETQLGKLKEMLKTAENAELIQEYIKGFESEEAFWDYQREKLEMNATIAAYEQNLENNYDKKNSDKDTETWDQHKEAVEEKLVEEQNVDINEDVLE